LTPLPNISDLSCTVRDHPELSKLKTESIRATKIIALERARSCPDIAIQVGVSTERYYREPALFFGVDIPLPIFDQNQGNITRATYEQYQSIYNQLSVERDFETKLVVLYEEWLTSYEQAITLRDEILPSMEESYHLAEEGYKDGKFHYLYLLDARIALYNVKQQYLDAAETYQHARADILRLTAGNFAEIDVASSADCNPLN